MLPRRAERNAGLHGRSHSAGNDGRLPSRREHGPRRALETSCKSSAWPWYKRIRVLQIEEESLRLLHGGFFPRLPENRTSIEHGGLFMHHLIQPGTEKTLLSPSLPALLRRAAGWGSAQPRIAACEPRAVASGLRCHIPLTASARHIRGRLCPLPEPG